MTAIFLSGGNGFIGRNIVEQCAQQYAISAPPRAELELTDADAVDHYFSQHQFDYIIHGANVGGTRKSQGDPQAYLKENVQAFNHVFKHRQEVTRFIQLGSGAEYGRPLLTGKISEADFGRKIPEDAYGRAKFTCAQTLADEAPAKAVNLRLFGVFGPYEDYQTRFISNAIVRALSGLPIVIHQDVKFDYLYVNDFIKILAEFIKRQPEFSHYNIGTGEPVSLSQVAEEIVQVLGVKRDIKIEQKGMGAEYSCDNARLSAFLGDGFTFTPLSESVLALAKWYESRLSSLNQEWIHSPV